MYIGVKVDVRSQPYIALYSVGIRRIGISIGPMYLYHPFTRSNLLAIHLYSYKPWLAPEHVHSLIQHLFTSNTQPDLAYIHST